MLRLLLPLGCVLLVFSACRRTCGPGTVEVDRVCVPDQAEGPTVAGVDDDRDGFTEAEGDCDDRDPNRSPTATDLAGDGVDQNCDGVDGVDFDADGFASIASGGEDCDDRDASVYPGAPEATDDPVDRDCDGAGHGQDPSRVLFGDITLQSAEAMDALCARYERVYGNVLVTGDGITSVQELDCLIEVVGDLTIERTSLVAVDLRGLRRVGGQLTFIHAEPLETLALPTLQEAGGVLVSGVPGLERLSLPALEFVSPWHLKVSSLALHDVELDELTHVDGELTMFGAALEALRLPALEHVGDHFVLNEPWAGVDLEVPLLGHVGSLAISEVGGLERLDAFGALRTIGRDLTVFNNPDLIDIEGLSSVESVGDRFFVQQNPRLPQSQVDALVDRDRQGEHRRRDPHRRECRLTWAGCAGSDPFGWSSNCETGRPFPAY